MASYISNQNNYTILELPGKQVFYNEFYLKLKLQAPGAGFLKRIFVPEERLLKSHENFTEFVIARSAEQIQWFRKVQSWDVNGSLSWGEAQIQKLESIDTDFLDILIDLIKKNLVRKTRVDGYCHEVSFYFETQEELEEFLKNYPREFQKNILYLENSLNSRVQPKQKLVKKRTTPRYRVYLRDQRQVTDDHRKLLDYLKNLGDQVKLPEKIKNEFSWEDPQDYYYNVYFYTDDLDILSFANLIVPNIIGRVIEIVEAPDS